MAQQKDFILPLFCLALALESSSAYSKSSWDRASESQVESETLSGMLKEQKLTWSEVKSIEERKNAVLSRIDEVLKNKNETIFSYQRVVEALERKLRDQKLSFKDKLYGEYEKRELASLIEAKDDTINELQGQVTKLDLQVEAMKKQFTRQDTHFRYQLTQLKKSYQKTFESISSGEAQLPEGMAMKLTSYQIQLDKFLDSGLNPAVDSSNEALEKRIAVQEETLAGLLKTNRDLVSDIRKVEDENALLKREIKTLHEGIAGAKQESASWQRLSQELQRSLSETERRLQIATVNFEGEKANLLAKIERQDKGALAPTRSPASALAPTHEESKHAEIVETYKSVTQKLMHAHFDWAPVIETGMVSLKVKESFYFDVDSYVLTEMSKDRLHTLMEIYSQEIFGNEELAAQIESIEFVGHSSPWYKSELIEPTLKYPEAFEYNMKLSIDRAREVVNYVFDGDFIEFAHKDEFRSKVKVSGQGHASPLVLRTPASATLKSDNQCAPYDCERSRRLDIIVHFKTHTP